MALFRCEHLTKIIDDYRLNDINFNIEPGTVMGLVGINGTGKTTLIRSILGSYNLDETIDDRGELFLNEKHYRKDATEYKSKIAYVLHENPFYKFMSSLEIGEVYGPYYKDFNIEKYRNLLKEFDIPEKKMISKLSKGQSIRMQLAFALSYPALLYVMDEPVGNLDVEFRDRFYDTVRDIVSNEQSSVILSNHLVTELENVADDLLWIGRTDNCGYIRYTGRIDYFKDCFRVLSVAKEKAGDIPKEMIMGENKNETHNEYLLYERSGDFASRLPQKYQADARYADLQEIMYFVDKK